MGCSFLHRRFAYSLGDLFYQLLTPLTFAIRTYKKFTICICNTSLESTNRNHNLNKVWKHCLAKLSYQKWIISKPFITVYESHQKSLLFTTSKIQIRHFWMIFKYCAWISNFRVFSKNIVLTFVCFEKEWRVFRIIYLEIRVPKIRFSLLSRYKQIVDDMIIQTDKNASDIDVENIVNRKVSLSVLVLAHFGLISIYFAVFFSAIIFECIFTSFFYPFF